MVDSEFTHPRMTGQDRRRIATRTLADATGIAFGFVRRPASALTRPHDRVYSESII
jgi:hypothetical protein